MTLAPSPVPSAARAPIRRFTVDEYHRMIEVGILEEDDPVELLEGLILYKLTRTPPHDVAVALAGKILGRLLPDGWHVRQQSAITTDDSEPEPDIAVVRGDERSYSNRHPGPADVAVVIEVADTSLARDRLDKLRLYARAGISVHWIVNLIDGWIEVYANPSASGSTAGYGSHVDFKRGQSLPLEIGGRQLTVRVDDLLP